MSGANLRVAKQQRTVDPPALRRLFDMSRKIGDRRRAARQPIERLGDIARQLAGVQLEPAQYPVQIRILDLENLMYPVDQLDIGVTAQLAKHSCALDGLVGQRIKFSKER